MMLLWQLSWILAIGNVRSKNAAASSSNCWNCLNWRFLSKLFMVILFFSLLFFCLAFYFLSFFFYLEFLLSKILFSIIITIETIVETLATLSSELSELKCNAKSSLMDHDRSQDRSDRSLLFSDWQKKAMNSWKMKKQGEEKEKEKEKLGLLHQFRPLANLDQMHVEFLHCWWIWIADVLAV